MTVKTPNKPNQDEKNQLSRKVRLVSEQPPGSFTQEIGKDVLFGRESTKLKNGETREWTIHRFVHACSRTREEDRESSPSRSTSSRLAAK